MVSEAAVVGILTYFIMLSAFYLRHIKWFHVSTMIFIIVFDLSMPVYLYLTRDWKTRLIHDGDIFSFGVWMHFGLIIALFVLYALQVTAGVKLLREDNDLNSRGEHKNVAKGILVVRALVIVSGALLAQPVLNGST
jgi:hypothetical protein